MEEKIKEIDEKIAKEEQNVEAFDITQFYLDKGRIYKEAKEKEKALAEFKKVIEKTQSYNTKMDAVFEILHIGILYKDLDLIKEYIDICRKFLTEGGDWEKKNKLKVYEGLYFLLTKKFKEAGKLFLEALMTFTNTELFEYKYFVFYTVIANIVTVDRVTLKNRVIDNSDVVANVREIPHLQAFLESFYNGNYRVFFEEFSAMIDIIKNDFFLSKHTKFFVSEMRIKVYSQFLKSYKSVTLENMAKSFGVSAKFIDLELSNFIAQGRISAKIDKVTGIVECTQTEPTVELYQKSIKESDILLNKLHRLSKLLEL